MTRGRVPMRGAAWLAPMVPTLLVVAQAVALAPGVAGAQGGRRPPAPPPARPAAPSAGPRLTVNGLAYDSLAGKPLAGAFITVQGLSRAAVSDGDGRFRFDTLPAGTYVFAMQHDVLDQAGLNGATARWSVLDGTERVVVAVPSLRTLWRTSCGLEPLPDGQGLLFGSVRHAATRRAVAGAEVQVTWTELIKTGGRASTDIVQRRWQRPAVSDEAGNFAVCGVPFDTPLRLRATQGALASGLVDLVASAAPVRRRDLLVGSTDTTARARAASSGTLTGYLADSTGAPLPNVRVVLDEVTAARSGPDGRFVVRAVPAGTRQVEFMAVGLQPYATTVDLFAGDTASVAATLRRLTTLEVVKVIGSATAVRFVADYEARRVRGIGFAMDSTKIPQQGTLGAVLRTIPNVNITPRSRSGRDYVVTFPSPSGEQCLATLFLDGVRQSDQAILATIYNDEIAFIEAFPNRVNIPLEFSSASGGCGVLSITTKRAIR